MLLWTSDGTMPIVDPETTPAAALSNATVDTAGCIAAAKTALEVTQTPLHPLDLCRSFPALTIATTMETTIGCPPFICLAPQWAVYLKYSFSSVSASFAVEGALRLVVLKCPALFAPGGDYVPASNAVANAPRYGFGSESGP